MCVYISKITGSVRIIILENIDIWRKFNYNFLEFIIYK